ncbi:MAG: hypothetical protein COY40_04690 [Alphaproteobacteria bacterium CG_4_10_14_0_8_um_filter_53_9]|nr:MAG: hypothetical protein COY40_04690 [Alphaproteobacteria bacterium CG_4_10_14_0_8_um_filter_53_9]
MSTNSNTPRMLIMVLSSLDGSTSTGGVDTVCSMHLAALQKYGDSQQSIHILAFNPQNTCKAGGEVHHFTPHITLYWHNLHQKDEAQGKAKYLPNIALQEKIIRAHIKTHKPGLVHSHVPGWHLKKYSGEKKVLTLHTYGKIGRRPRSLWNNILHEYILQPVGLSTADILITVSKEIEGRLKNRKKNITYIPNPLAESFFSRPIPRPTQNKTVHILLSGHVQPRKRPHEAVMALSLVHKTHPHTHLHIVGSHTGEGGYLEALQNQIKKQGLTKHVTFHGHTTPQQLRDIMATCHIGLCMSEEETFGLAPLEMMTRGLPIVTTSVGVFSWSAADLAPLGAHMIPVGDPVAAARALSQIIMHKAFTTPPKAQHYLKSHFSLESYLAQTENVYQSVLPAR